jgi:hypothetical protein
VRRRAISFLGSKDARKHIKAHSAVLVKALGDRYYSVKAAAIRAIIDLADIYKNDAAATAAVKKMMLSDRSTALQSLAAQALAAMGRPKSEYIAGLRAGLLATTCTYSQQSAAIAMCKSVPGGAAEVVAALERKDLKKCVQRSLLRGAAQSKTTKCVRHVMSLVRSKRDVELRARAIYVIQVEDRKDARAYVKLLKAALRGNENELKEKALERLATASHYRSVPGIGKLFGEVKRLVGQLAWTSRALPALAYMPRRKAMPVALGYAFNNQDSLRDAALEVLRKMVRMIDKGRDVPRGLVRAVPKLRAQKSTRLVGLLCADKLKKGNRALSKACEKK